MKTSACLRRFGRQAARVCGTAPTSASAGVVVRMDRASRPARPAVLTAFRRNMLETVREMQTPRRLSCRSRGVCHGSAPFGGGGWGWGVSTEYGTFGRTSRLSRTSSRSAHFPPPGSLTFQPSPVCKSMLKLLPSPGPSRSLPRAHCPCVRSAACAPGSVCRPLLLGWSAG